MATSNPQDYRPRYQVGDLVHIGADDVIVHRVTDRSVTRNRHRCTTNYALVLVEPVDADAPTACCADESSLTLASEYLEPMVAAERIVRQLTRDEHPRHVTVTRSDCTLVISTFWRESDASATLSAPMTADGRVQMVGAWRWSVWHDGGESHVPTWETNVGAALVEAHNALWRLGRYATGAVR